MRKLFALSVTTLAVAWLAATPASAGAKGPSGKLPPQWTALVNSFDATMSGDHQVGGSIALVEQGRIVARRNYGFADRTNGKRVDDDTIFHWASNTKTLNAITIMQLRDRGLLTLDEPVTRRVPELRRMHNPYGSMDAITITMLLTHSAGFQAVTWPYRQGLPWEPFEPTQWDQLVAMMPYQEVAFPPGSKFSYSNPAWIYLARILEDITDDPWQYYVQKNLFTPLGMDRSYFGSTPAFLQAHRSHSYAVRKGADGKPVVEDLGGDFDPGITIPNGGWNAPLADVATYIAFLTHATHDDPKVAARYASVLKRSTLEEMWQPRFSMDLYGAEDKNTQPDQIGLGFFLSHMGAHRFIGHTGGQNAFATFFYFDPETGRGVIGALNTGAGEVRPASEQGAFFKLRNAAIKVFE